MDDAKKVNAANWKLIHGTRPKVGTPDTASPRAEKSGGRKKRQEPPCPINVKDPKLGAMIDDWLTFMRQEVDEQQKRTKSVETSDSQSGQSEEDSDGVLVCVYDRKDQICSNQNRRSSNGSSSCSQPASPNGYNVGDNINLTGSNHFVPSKNCKEPKDNYRNPSNTYKGPSYNHLYPRTVTTGTCSRQSNEDRRPSVCLNSQMQTSNSQDKASNDRTQNSVIKVGCPKSTCRFQQRNAHHKQPDIPTKQARSCFKPPKKAFKLPNTAFDQLQISHAPLLHEKLDTCSLQPNGYSDPV